MKTENKTVNTNISITSNSNTSNSVYCVCLL